MDPEKATPDPSTDAETPEVTGFTRPSVIRVALLVAGLVVVTGAAIAIGRQVEPASPTTAAPAATVPATTTVAAGTTTRPAVVAVISNSAAVTRWGPLPVKAFGRFRPAGGQSGAALDGSTLVVVGGAGSDRVVAGPAGRPLGPAGSLPGPRAAPQVFTAGNVVYTVGGEDGQTVSADIVRLAPAKSEVVPAGTFEEPLAEAGVAQRGGSVYFAGGWTGVKYATAVLRFTPPSTVDLIARLPVAVRSPAVALLRHTPYVAGGATSAGLSDQMFAVDIDSGAVTTLDNLPQALQQAVLLVSGTKLYLLGGKTASGKALTDILSIDPATGQATHAGHMPAPLAGAAAVPMGSRTLVVASASGRVYRVG